MSGIQFNNFHTEKDFGISIYSRDIEIAQKRTLKQQVPFMNGEYDFSGLYGDDCYESRELKYVFNVLAKDRMQLRMKIRQLTNAFMSASEGKIYDDLYPGYYFVGKCVSCDQSLNKTWGKFSVTFDAKPFMYGANYEGHDIWDIFNFEEDYAQQTAFTITNLTDIILYNPSAISITPTVICTSDMTIQMNNTTYKFVAGTTEDYRFKLAKGENRMTITGQGNIEFKFRKEVL